MNISLAREIEQSDSEIQIENEFGETPLSFAPRINIEVGHSVVPQQFLDVNRSLQNVEAILAKINVPKGFLLFAGEERGLVYITCGVIGRENYIKHPHQRNEKKIVYGRRWLLEPTTPTSEVIQTALLAVKKAREHELREHIVFLLDEGGVEGSQVKRRTTPFNTHMDLPLMASRIAHNPTFFKTDGSRDWCVVSLLANIEIDGLLPVLERVHDVSCDRKLYDIRLQFGEKEAECFAELQGKRLTLLCEEGTKTEFLHQLFNALLAISDATIDDTFEFDGFARFSRAICPSEMADFSYKTRNVVAQDQRFGQHFQDMSYRVDSSKAPAINAGDLGKSQQQMLNDEEQSNGPLAGYLPHGYHSHSFVSVKKG